jgi:hypothetical protein
LFVYEAVQKVSSWFDFRACGGGVKLSLPFEANFKLTMNRIQMRSHHALNERILSKT